ncbi:hypothetical protein ACFUIW_25320 [Streptomyces sp. NPDC057245]|uniref:hypothetical protein n=1 Tax=Streptomyces sp. NPDC057245 TaxID=3346065 RepID=UPI003643DFDD
MSTYSAWANETPRRGFWNHLWEEARNAATKNNAPNLGRKITQLDPFDLEVHRSIESGAEELNLPLLPAYIQRFHDNELKSVVAAAAEGSSGIAILVGESSTGKTRACWEAIQQLPHSWSLRHPIYPSHAEALAYQIEEGIPPRTVLWLNETQLYLSAPASGTGERIAAGLRELIRDSTCSPVLILGTLWPEHWDELTRTPGRGEDDNHPQARSLISGSSISVPASFTSGALEELRERMESDPRLADSFIHTRGGEARITQFLAGAPAQIDRYQHAPEEYRAIIDAAIDLRRFGQAPVIPNGLLHDMTALTMATNVYSSLPDDWFEEGTTYALAPCRGASGLLARFRPLPGAPPQVEPAYRLSDYIEQVGRSNRATLAPPQSFTFVVLRHIRDVEQLNSIASSMLDRGRNFDAAQIYLRASQLGDYASAHKLADILDFAGDRTGAAEVIEMCYRSGDPDGSEFLAYYLYRSGQEEAAEALCLEEFNRGNCRPWVKIREAYELADNETGHDQLEDRLVSYDFPEIMTLVRSANFNEARKAAIKSVAKRLDISELEAEERFEAEVESALPRLELITEARAAHTRVLMQSLDSLKEYSDKWKKSEKSRKTKAILKEIAELEKAENYNEAKKVVIQGLNEGLIGIEKLGSLISRQGDESLGEAMERQGIDWCGNLAPPWGLREVRKACDSAL